MPDYREQTTPGGNSLALPLHPSVTAIRAAAAAQGMTSATKFGPGSPIQPMDGYNRVPRSFEYRPGYNINARPRAEVGTRMSFHALKALIDNYDIAQMAITHRIDSLRALDWQITPMEGEDGDLTQEIEFARRVLRKPDGKLFFRPWLSKYLTDVLRYDAGTLYKIRSNSGHALGLRVIDGTSIVPLIDDHGNEPDADAPAYVQYQYGVPWNWLSSDEIIYMPYRPQPDSVYGQAPIEGILLNANLDLKFQLYFMQRFTSGNIPEGFAIAPDTWGPDQIEDFEAKWDALLYGDQEVQHQIKWLPGGSQLEFPNKTEFTADFSTYLLKKTASAFHVSPADLGFTDDVNRSTGDSQLSVQQRVGDLPLGQHVEDVLTSFLQDDLGLPVEFHFEFGLEQEDRLATAQSDQIYIESGVVSASKIAELRFGIADPEGSIVPRFISLRGNLVPVSTLQAQSTPIDENTAAPEPGTVHPAEQAQVLDASTASDPTTADTVTDLAPVTAPVAKGAQRDELTAFRKFAANARRKGTYRPFQFDELDAVEAHRLNVGLLADIRKADGETVAAGLAVLAQDTGRVLMIQRALDPTDKASGLWEFPGGHLEAGETPLVAAQREWAEETGQPVPPGAQTGVWASADGVYEGFVWVVGCEADVPVRSPGIVLNPDDPDGDCPEAIAWWEPASLLNNPAVRVELALSLPDLFAALRQEPAAVEAAEYALDDPDATAGEALAVGARIVEADAAPLAKAGWRDDLPAAPQPQHDYDLPITDHYAPLIASALEVWVDALPLTTLTGDLIMKATAEDVDRDSIAAQVMSRLTGDGDELPTEQLEQLIREVLVDGYTAGSHAAVLQLGPGAVYVPGPTGDAIAALDWADWKPGSPLAADQLIDGGLRNLLDGAGVTIRSIVDTSLDKAGNAIAAGVARGDTVDAIAASLRDLVASPDRAVMIAHTETARGMTAASLETYRVNGVAEWDLLTTAGACPACLLIEAANPHPVTDSGDGPPVHPYCRCAASPHTQQ